MSDRFRGRLVKRIERITGDLLKVRAEIAELGVMQGLSREQARAIESLGRGLDGVRGFELGEARQSLGLDEGLVRMSAELRSGKGFAEIAATTDEQTHKKAQGRAKGDK